MQYFLGLDIGTSGTKALLVNELGESVAAATELYELSTPRHLWAEQQPDDWWQAVIRAVRSVLEKASIASDAITSIGLSGQMHGSVFIDACGNVIRPAILWCDQRTQRECDEITQAVGIDQLSTLIGNPVLTGFTAPKIAWLRRHEPENFARLRKVLLPKDYIRFKLSGVFATDVSDASGTALFDVVNRKWSQQMLSVLDIPADWMPECTESIAVSSSVNATGATETGLAVGTPIIGGAGDQAAGAVGSGIVSPGIVSSTIGTSGVVFAYADQPAIDKQLRIHTFCHAVPGKWHSMGVVLSAGGSLRWLRDTFYSAVGAVPPDSSSVTYETIIKEAMSVPTGSEGLLFLPYLTGERTPYPDPNARGTFVGATLRHTRAHFARAVLEGVGYAMNDTFRIFADIGIPMHEVRTSGGGAKSPEWRQIQTDITGFEHVCLREDEGPALGAALLSAVGVGHFSSVDEACRTSVFTKDASKVNAPAHEIYSQFNEVYSGLYASLKPMFSRITEIVNTI